VEHPENNEKPMDKCKVKFKIVSLKVKGPVEYVPELVSYLSTSPGRLIVLFSLNVGNLRLTDWPSPFQWLPTLKFLTNLLLQFDEQKDQVAVEQILRVVFLDAERPSPVRLNKTSSFYSVLVQCN
jgi:hypothetical protein